MISRLPEKLSCDKHEICRHRIARSLVHPTIAPFERGRGLAEDVMAADAGRYAVIAFCNSSVSVQREKFGTLTGWFGSGPFRKTRPTPRGWTGDEPPDLRQVRHPKLQPYTAQ